MVASGNVKSPIEFSEEEWNHLFAINLTGTWLVSKFVCKQMCNANQKGSLINISSIGGLQRGTLPGGLPYNLSKMGVNCMTKVNNFFNFNH